MKCVQANTFPLRASNFTCTSGCSSENYRNRGPTQAPNAPRLTTNVSQAIEEAQESAPTLCQTNPLVVFQPVAPASSPSFLTRRAKCTDLPARANTIHEHPVLTETAAPVLAKLAAVRSGKIN